jgi:YHS domain-containing protein
MDVWLVDLAVLTLIVVIIWYFFLSRRRDEAQATAGPERQEITVRVKGGYIPEVVRARPGLPVRIHFKREETSPCSEEVVFPTLGVRRHLPAFETTAIDLPASSEGTYAFACGMDMMHGWLVVGEPPADMPQPAAAEGSWPTDPVCGMKVNPEKAAATLERDGKTYYFCCAGCQERFLGQAKPPAAAQPLVQIEIGRKR